jgi:hypothetical protein
MKKISQLSILALFILILSGCDAAEMTVTNINKISNSNQATINQNVNQEAVLGEKIENSEVDESVVTETVVSDTSDATPEPAPAIAPVATSAPAVVPAPAPVVVPAPKPEPVVVPPSAPVSNCDPNYTPCVPIASDVDCAGGSGNGPAYVEGPVRVIGSDIYRLDSDHDGIGCE